MRNIRKTSYILIFFINLMFLTSPIRATELTGNKETYASEEDLFSPKLLAKNFLKNAAIGASIMGSFLFIHSLAYQYGVSKIDNPNHKWAVKFYDIKAFPSSELDYSRLEQKVKRLKGSDYDEFMAELNEVTIPLSKKDYAYALIAGALALPAIKTIGFFGKVFIEILKMPPTDQGQTSN